MSERWYPTKIKDLFQFGFIIEREAIMVCFLGFGFAYGVIIPNFQGRIIDGDNLIVEIPMNITDIGLSFFASKKYILLNLFGFKIIIIFRIFS